MILGVNIDVKVIQDGCWPFPKTLPNFNLPSCLEQSVKDFTEFYEEKEGRKRRLKWFYHHSQADVRTCLTSKMYVLKEIFQKPIFETLSKMKLF